MADTALVNATKKRDSLAAEINSLAQRADELKRELAKIDAWIAQWHEFAKEAELPVVAQHIIEIRPGEFEFSKRRRTTGNPKKEDVAEAAIQIIKERNEPVSRADLFKALAERGVVITSGTDPEMVLSTMLWRMRDMVVRLKGGGYWLANEPYEPAGFDPLDHFPESMEAEKERRVQVDVFE